MAQRVLLEDDDLLESRAANGYPSANGALDSVSERGSEYSRPHNPRVLRIPAKQAVAHVNILVAGGAGLGKTTFIKQFLNEFVSEGLVPHDGTQTPLEKFKKEGGPGALCTHLSEAVRTSSGEYEVYYHIQDTPGHGNVNNNELKRMVMHYVHGEKEAHFRIRLERQNDGQAPQQGDPLREGRPDRLIDLCLYFIPPQCFSQVDVDFISELSKEVLVVPVCAKADAMTSDERVAFQQLIRDRLTQEGITFAYIEEELKWAAKNIGLPPEGLSSRPPFVVVSSNTYRQVEGELKAVRQYPWGDCVITNPLHSDFTLIKEFVTTTAFHKLRSSKKRMFHRYCRQRMGTAPTPPPPAWDDKYPSSGGGGGSVGADARAHTKAREANEQSKAREASENMREELERMKAELAAEKAQRASFSTPATPPRTPSKTHKGEGEGGSVKSKGGIFTRIKS